MFLKSQVTELDKFAKRLKQKRAKIQDMIQKDEEEIAQIDNQISMIMTR